MIAHPAKAVCYIVDRGRLLVFTHDDRPLEDTGVQVPAGTVEPGEDPAEAAVREAREETGLRTRVIRALGEMDFDFRPTRQEVARRHFFLMEPVDPEVPWRWSAGEEFPSDGGAAVRWTCWWLPLDRAHVLSGGFSQAIGRIFDA